MLKKSRFVKRYLKGVCLGLLCLLVLIQFVPYGRSHTNPPVVQEPVWDSPLTRELFFRACMDCHSNETNWPWYSNIAPVSWLIQADVDEGRGHFNISEWNRKQNDGDEAAEEFRDGEMPLWFYLPTHPEARLTAAERKIFEAGLVATFGEDDGEGHDDH